jgi:hypothetical protein
MKNFCWFPSSFTKLGPIKKLKAKNNITIAHSTRIVIGTYKSKKKNPDHGNLVHENRNFFVFCANKKYSFSGQKKESHHSLRKYKFFLFSITKFFFGVIFPNM